MVFDDVWVYFCSTLLETGAQLPHQEAYAAKVSEWPDPDA
jgi:hypothetical protein